MKKILFAAAAVLGLAFVSPDGARAGGPPRVSVSFGVPLPVVVVPSRGYYYEEAPVYYDGYARRRYYRRPARDVYRGRAVRSGYREYYREGRYCD